MLNLKKYFWKNFANYRKYSNFAAAYHKTVE